MIFRRPGVLLAAALLVCAPSFAAPAAANAAAQQSSGATLAEIVVTAEKRHQPLLEVPAAVTVVTGASLQSAGIDSAESLEQLVPTLTFERGSTNSNATLAIRGIGTQSFSPAAQPSVAVVVDGVVMGRPGMAFGAFTDVNRIEVLNGPQGTLYGMNATAGVLNVVTPDPTRHFEGNASISWYEGHEYHARLNLSGPLNDHIGYQVSMLYQDFPGNIYNVYNHQQTNGYRRQGIRGKIVDDVNDVLKVTLEGNYYHSDDNCCADVLGAYVPNAAWTNIFLPELQPSVPGPNALSINNDTIPSQINTNSGVSATVEWSLGKDTLTSISAFQRWYNFQGRDGDFHSGCCSYVNPLDIKMHDRGGLDYKQYSEEIRLASPVDQFASYTVGAFIWHSDEQDYFSRHVEQCTASTLAADATGFQPCATGVSTFLNTTGTANFDTRNDNQALFGQTTLHLTKRLSLIAGGRYTHDYVAYTFGRVDSPSTGPGIAPGYTGTGNTANDGWSAKGGLKFSISSNSVAYATYSRGWLGPAFNVFFNMSALNAAPVAPETANDFELGLKNQFFDHTLVLNLAAWYETFNNFQANSFVVTNGSVTTSLTNAGTVRSTGVSADFDWQPTRRLSISGGYSYDKAYIVSYNCAGQVGAALTSCRDSHQGEMFPFAPKNKLTIMPSWLLPLHNVGYTARLNVTYSYTSQTNFDIDPNPMAQQPAYSLLGASLVMGFDGGRYHLSFIGHNLTNQFYTVFITPTGNGVAPGSYQRLQIPRDAFRYWGVKFSANF
ncbi:MAG: TonB-dependent receptor [Steroidobacteraceae bacterium]